MYHMNESALLNAESLNKMDKDALITIVLSQQEQLKSISRQLDFLTEQISVYLK